jgi:hypothetical protein
MAKLQGEQLALFKVEIYARIHPILSNPNITIQEINIEYCKKLMSKELKQICSKFNLSFSGSKLNMLDRIRKAKNPPKSSKEYREAMSTFYIENLKLDSISDFSKDELKDIADKFGIKSIGSKKQLINRIVTAKARVVDKKWRDAMKLPENKEI